MIDPSKQGARMFKAAMVTWAGNRAKDKPEQEGCLDFVAPLSLASLIPPGRFSYKSAGHHSAGFRSRKTWSFSSHSLLAIRISR